LISPLEQSGTKCLGLSSLQQSPATALVSGAAWVGENVVQPPSKAVSSINDIKIVGNFMANLSEGGKIPGYTSNFPKKTLVSI
jgi:hypothetical protein